MPSLWNAKPHTAQMPKTRLFFKTVACGGGFGAKKALYVVEDLNTSVFLVRATRKPFSVTPNLLPLTLQWVP